MATAGMGLRGADQLVDALEAVARELADLGDAHAQAGRLLADRGAATAPRRTGYLAEHVAAVVVADRVTVTARAPYAVYVHARDPWLARELVDLEPQVVDIYAAAVAATVDRHI